MNNSVDYEQRLVDLNNEKANLLLPAILFVAILMLIGTFGNCMILYFYGYKSKTSPSVSFIFALAVFDLVSCLVGMPMEIVDLRYFFNFKSEPACKILRFVTHFASISSGITLVAIAIDRYRRLCKPFQRQLNAKHVKVICVITAVVSVLFSWPAVIFNEVVDVVVKHSDGTILTGKDCTTTKREKYRPYLLAFNTVYLVAFIIITVFLAVLYTFIARQLIRHTKFRSYVAKRSTKVKRINVMSDSGSGKTLITPHETSTLSSKMFEDPPDVLGSVVDMKEFVTRGLPKVDNDRPTSGYTVITETTGITRLTDHSCRSKHTLHSTKSTKSVTICDPSHNQIFAIEARQIVRPTSSKSEQSWTSVDGRRPGTISSFATFSSRPSSAAFSTFSEFSKVGSKLTGDITYSEYDDSDGDGKDDERGDVLNLGHISGDNDGRTSIRLFEHDIDGETVTVTDETVSSLDDTDVEHDKDTVPNDPNYVSEEITHTDYIRGNRIPYPLSDITEDIETEKNETVTMDKEESDNQTNIHNYNPTGNKRQHSTLSSKSHRSRSSGNSRRSNVVTPVSDVTMASSVASRASTVRRIKHLLQNNIFKNGTLNSDANNIKELRMKMLDINTVKYTLVMLVITIVFVLSFMPYLALVIWRYLNDDHEVNILSDTELVMFQIGIRSIFLNSSINPIIYGGFNSKFRAFFYSACCVCCLSWKRKKKKRRNQFCDQSDSTSGT